MRLERLKARLVELLPDSLAEYFRPELMVDPEIVEREKRFEGQGQGRKQWVQRYVKLSVGSLTDLKKINPQAIAWFVANKGGVQGVRHKRVVVFGKSNEYIVAGEKHLEGKLKEEIFLRGANAGVLYRQYRQGERMVAEAVPISYSIE